MMERNRDASTEDDVRHRCTRAECLLHALTSLGSRPLSLQSRRARTRRATVQRVAFCPSFTPSFGRRKAKHRQTNIYKNNSTSDSVYIYQPKRDEVPSQTEKRPMKRKSWFDGSGLFVDSRTFVCFPNSLEAERRSDSEKKP